MIRSAAMALIVLMAAGCLSVPEVNYYTLDLRSSGQVEADYAIDRIRIDTGEAVSRPEIMIRTSPTQIEYYATQVWAAGLDELVTEKLKAEFGMQTQSLDEEVDIDGDVLAFEQVDTVDGADAHVKLDITFTISDSESKDKRKANQVYEITVPAADRSPVAIVDALSRATEEIASQMADDLARALSRAVE